MGTAGAAAKGRLVRDVCVDGVRADGVRVASSSSRVVIDLC